MIVGTIVKQLAEKLPASIDFTRRLLEVSATETIVSATVTAIRRDTGADATSDVLEGTVGITGGIVRRMTKGGVNGIEYVLTFRATSTPAGAILEDELVLRLKETTT